MQYLLSVLLVLVSSTYVRAWYNRFDNAVYGGGWAPNRRSHSNCLALDERCVKSYQCCLDDKGVQMKCMIANTLGLGEFGFGECKPTEHKLQFYEHRDKFSLLKAGAPCKDSSECYDECCRLIRMGRLGYKQKCGKPAGDACIGGSISSNDVMSGLDDLSK